MNRLSYDGLQVLLYQGMLVLKVNSMQMFERRLVACGFAAHPLVKTLRAQVATGVGSRKVVNLQFDSDCLKCEYMVSYGVVRERKH